nr:MAG TPA: hypothetical protein [Caudoviricetes sp.]
MASLGSFHMLLVVKSNQHSLTMLILNKKF